MSEADNQADFGWLRDFDGKRQQQEWTAAVEKLFHECGGGNDTLRRAMGEMQSYRSHGKAGSGQELFRAYLGYRALVKDAEAKRGADLAQLLQYGLRMEPQAYVDALREQLGVEALAALDAVIEDLAKFCDKPGPVDDQLPNIRSALRLDGERAPDKLKFRRQRQEAGLLWARLYFNAIGHGLRRSRNDIARQVARELGISRTKALNCAPSIDGQLHQALTERVAATAPRRQLTKPAAQRAGIKFGRTRR